MDGTISSTTTTRFKKHDGGLAPGVEPKPPRAREPCTDEKRYPHAELEEHNQTGVA